MLRQATSNECKDISDLISNTIKTSHTGYTNYQNKLWTSIYTPEKINSLMQEWVFVVYEMDAIICGTGAYFQNELHSVFVHPVYQNKGIGKDIVAYIESQIKENYNSLLIIGAAINALSFYTNLNYSIIGEECNEFQMKVFIMKKDLQL